MDGGFRGFLLFDVHRKTLAQCLTFFQNFFITNYKKDWSFWRAFFDESLPQRSHRGVERPRGIPQPNLVGWEATPGGPERIARRWEPSPFPPGLCPFIVGGNRFLLTGIRSLPGCPRLPPCPPPHVARKPTSGATPRPPSQRWTCCPSRPGRGPGPYGRRCAPHTVPGLTSQPPLALGGPGHLQRERWVTNNHPTHVIGLGAHPTQPN